MEKEAKRKGEGRGILLRAFRDTVPVMAGYLVLGTGFGLMLHDAGYGLLWAVCMSITMFAGSMQYAAVGLISGGASLITVALTTLLVNARHLFYGISMGEKYADAGAVKPYLIFGLTDETYSLLCTDAPGIPAEQRTRYRFFVTLLDHCWWICGSAIGVLLGEALPFSTEGVDFALTALFISILTDQWLTLEDHVPTLIGLGATLLSLLLFGPDTFLLPAMAIIAAALLFLEGRRENG